MSKSATEASSAAQSPAELLYSDFPAEFASTRRVLARYPEGKGDWEPHGKSRTLSQLATHVADIVNRGTDILTTDFMEAGGRPPLTPLDSAHALLEHFDNSVEQFDRSFAASSLESLARPWSIRAGGRVFSERPRREQLRVVMMSHLIHHRAQPGVYYRLLDVAVPGVYGPSADE